jgi:signal transduction histidine kinase
LFVAWLNSKSGWRLLYANLFGASLIYAASSYLANWALSRHSYYSGSLYDIPLTVSMAWITVVGLWTREREPEAGVRSISTSHGVWLARLGMIAAFSLPLFATWALLDGGIPPRIRSFRLVLTLGAALLMSVMVFVRQRLLDRELVRLLADSRESFANLKRLQAQITESEKLASVGRLVGGAAHELNNPIAAMLGYSDLLLVTPLNPEQKELAEKIGQHVRRSKSLVASLLSFAKQGPATMAPVDMNTVLRTAVKLSQPQWQALKIEVNTELQADERGGSARWPNSARYRARPRRPRCCRHFQRQRRQPGPERRRPHPLRCGPQRLPGHPPATSGAHLSAAGPDSRELDSHRASRHPSATGEIDWRRGSGDVAAATVRLSWPQAA